MTETTHPDYDAGLLNDFGGGNTGWWLDYIRAEIGRANDHWRDHCDTQTDAVSLVQDCTIDLRGAGYHCVDRDGDVCQGVYGEGDLALCEGAKVTAIGLHILGPVAIAEKAAEIERLQRALLASQMAQAEAEALEEQHGAVVERLREALKFYANPEIYKPHPHGIGFDNRDASFVAHSALAVKP